MVRSASSLSSAVCSDNLSEVGDDAGFDRMQEAVRTLLQAVGEDLCREGLRDTPKRVAKAWLDVSSGYRKELGSVVGEALFHEPIVHSGSNGMVIVKDVDFASTSEYSLLPFHGTVHIAYVPANGVVLGLSKVARMAKLFASRLQTQERFTQELLSFFQQSVAPEGAAIIVAARHMEEDPAAQPRYSSAACGGFVDPHSTLLQEFITMLQMHGVVIPSTTGMVLTPGKGSAAYAVAEQAQSEPQQSAGLDTIAAYMQTGAVVSTMPQVQPSSDVCLEDSVQLDSMEQAMEAVLREIGEDPLREGLRGSARRYSKLLLASTAGYHHSLEAMVGELASPTTNGWHSGPAPALTPPPGGDMSELRLEQCHVQFASQCEHHLLPFYGTVHLAYLAGREARPLGSAQLGAIVQLYSRRLQVQERLSHQIADAVEQAVGCSGCIVVAEAVHMCMVARGVEKHASSTITCAARGRLLEDSALRIALLRQLSAARTF